MAPIYKDPHDQSDFVCSVSTLVHNGDNTTTNYQVSLAGDKYDSNRTTRIASVSTTQEAYTDGGLVQTKTLYEKTVERPMEQSSASLTVASSNHVMVGEDQIDNGKKGFGHANSGAVTISTYLESPRVTLTIRDSATGRNYTFVVDQRATVKHLKDMICDKTGISPKNQILMFAGEELKDDRSFCNYNLRDGSVISLERIVIQVFVKDLQGKTHTIQISRRAHVKELKDKIYEKLRIVPSQQRLVFGLHQLQDERTLESYGIQDSSTIDLTARLRGG